MLDVNLGFVARIAPRSGRDDNGTGGGTADTLLDCARGRFGVETVVGCGLFNPIESADLLTFSTLSAEGREGIFLAVPSTPFSLCCGSTFREGSLGGNVGRCSRSFEVRVDETLLVLEGARLAYLGLSDEYFLGGSTASRSGKGGSSHSPQAGAFILSLDFVLLRFNLLSSPSVVVAEMIDVTEPLLGGSSELFRCGGGGACWRMGNGGGAGWLPIRESVMEPLTSSGGLLTVFCLTIMGRLLGT